MSTPIEKANLLRTIQVLVDRLASPDLTASEARSLRPRLLELVGTMELSAKVGVPTRAEAPCKAAV